MVERSLTARRIAAFRDVRRALLECGDSRGGRTARRFLGFGERLIYSGDSRGGRTARRFF